MTPAANRRTLGVEEEFLLVDVRTGQPAPAAGQVTGGLDLGADPRRGGAERIEHELTLQQVETSSAVSTGLAELRADLVALRREAATAAAAAGTVLIAAGTSPVPVAPSTTPSPRYHRMTQMYGLTAWEQLTCGCHVHVGVDSEEEGVAALDRVRPWLPTLVALTANSPFWQGRDSSYASYRSQVWGRWPSSGPPPVFGSVPAYRACVQDLLDSGTILDEGMIYFDARLARHYPTIELRVADVALEVDDAVLLAALAGGLVETAVRHWRDGVPPPRVASELIRMATWRAGRSGLEGDLVDLSGPPRPVPAVEAVQQLVAHVTPALADAGRLDDVRELVDQLLGRGTGAARQRAAHRQQGRLADVVLLLAEHTVPS